MARPPEMGKTRDAGVLVRVLPEERKRWAAAAKKAGVSLAAWMRGLANTAAPPKKLKKPKKQVTDAR